jgi:hypothetical protein
MGHLATAAFSIDVIDVENWWGKGIEGGTWEAGFR